MADDSGEKSEEPTPKKIEDARKEGNVPKSQDFSAFITLLVAIAVLVGLMGHVFDRIELLYRYFLSFIGQDITQDLIISIAIRMFLEMVIMIFPIAVVIMIAGVLSNVMQFGFNFTTKPLTPNFGKLNPIKGFKNVISMKKLIEGAKSTVKVMIIFVIAFYYILDILEELSTVTLYSLHGQLTWLEEQAIIIASIVLALFLVFAIIDLWFVRYNYKKELKMTKQQVKDEYKQLDGDPRIKAKIREIQMRMAKNRMMADIPSADVVITNPTHYAIAIRYDKSKEATPIVIAKGVDRVAMKIKEIAREASVEIVENPALARELYKVVDLGASIPPKLYKAVAEVLAFVYQAKNKL